MIEEEEEWMALRPIERISFRGTWTCFAVLSTFVGLWHSPTRPSPLLPSLISAVCMQPPALPSVRHSAVFHWFRQIPGWNLTEMSSGHSVPGRTGCRLQVRPGEDDWFILSAPPSHSPHPLLHPPPPPPRPPPPFPTLPHPPYLRPNRHTDRNRDKSVFL